MCLLKAHEVQALTDVVLLAVEEVLGEVLGGAMLADWGSNYSFLRLILRVYLAVEPVVMISTAALTV